MLISGVVLICVCSFYIGLQKTSKHEVAELLECNYKLKFCFNSAQVLLEHQDGELDAALHPLLEKQSFKTATGFAIRMGKNIVEFDPNFRYASDRT